MPHGPGKGICALEFTELNPRDDLPRGVLELKITWSFPVKGLTGSTEGRGFGLLLRNSVSGYRASFTVASRHTERIHNALHIKAGVALALISRL